METIFLVLERFNHYSDVLRGKLIRTLADRYRVVVITPDLDPAVVRQFRYFQHPSVVYRKLQPAYRWLWHLAEVYLRKYFVREFDDLALTDLLYYRYPVRRRDRLLRDIGALTPKLIATASFWTGIERVIARPSREVRGLVREYRPRLMVLATAGFGYLPLVAELAIAAHRLGIPSVAINSTFDTPLTMPKFLRKTDYVTVWNSKMKQAAGRYWGYAPERVFIAGCLKFDHYFTDLADGLLRSRETFLRSKGLDPKRKTILYVTPTPGTYKWRKDLMEELVRLKRQGRLVGDPNILVRLHPFDVWEPYDEFAHLSGIWIERAGRQRAADDVGGPKVEMEESDLVNLTETLVSCDVLVGFTSTMVLEAAIFDKPTVSIGWPEKFLKGYEIGAELPNDLRVSGATRFAAHPEQLVEFVNEYLRHPERDRAARKDLVGDYVYFTDGRSYERIADCIGTILQAAAARVPRRAPALEPLRSER